MDNLTPKDYLEATFRVWIVGARAYWVMNGYNFVQQCNYGVREVAD